MVTTASVDEHTEGIHAGATPAAVSDTAGARAALLAARAYPKPLTLPLPRPEGSVRPRSAEHEACTEAETPD